MPELDPAEVLAGIDRPRAVPADVRAGVEAALLSGSRVAGSPLAGIDGPRPLPPSTRARLELAVAAAVGAPLGGGSGWRRLPVVARTRVLGVAAAVLVVLGLVAAATRPVIVDTLTGLAGESTVERDRTTLDLGVGSGPTTTALLAATTMPPTTAGATVVALAESEPAYARLEAFDSCAALLDWIRPRAEDVTNEYGFQGALGGFGNTPSRPADGAPSAQDPGEPQRSPQVPSTGGGSAGRVTTNVQEAGVDEPDLLKVTDDGTILVLTYEALQVVAAGGGTPRLTASVSFVGTGLTPAGLLVEGDTAMVYGLFQGADGKVATHVRLFDVSDPEAPVAGSVVELPGHPIDVRAIDNVAHLVTGWTPGPFGFVYPDGSEVSVEQAREENRRAVRESTVEQWVPPGVACEDIHRPRDLAGMSVTQLWSFPIGDPGAAEVAAVLADPGTVYATRGAVVVATNRWERTPDVSSAAVRTNLHRFALEPGGARYTASGSVPGFLRSSWSMSEHEGHLRVATTSGDSSGSTVTVLDDAGDGTLVPIGSVGGLGVNQEIQGIRFVGDIAFVVTFRRTDPLYTIDLSDPAAPRVRGALEVTGFSGYLHLLDDGRLLGVGVEADEGGRTTGGAVSIYDVSDLDHPTMAQRLTDPTAAYAATDEPHAFFLSGSGDVVLPTNHWNQGVDAEGNHYSEPENGFDVFRLAPGGLVAAGRVTHEGHGETSRYGTAYRAFVLDDVLYTVSSAGVLASDPRTLADRGWAALPPWTSSPEPTPVPMATTAPEPVRTARPAPGA